MTGLTMYVVALGKEGALTDATYALMLAMFGLSNAYRAGFVPVAVVVDQDAPEPVLGVDANVIRTRMPQGHVALLLDHELGY